MRSESSFLAFVVCCWKSLDQMITRENSAADINSIVVTTSCHSFCWILPASNRKVWRLHASQNIVRWEDDHYRECHLRHHPSHLQYGSNSQHGLLWTYQWVACSHFDTGMIQLRIQVSKKFLTTSYFFLNFAPFHSLTPPLLINYYWRRSN